MKKFSALFLICLMALSLPSPVFGAICVLEETPGSFRGVVCLFVDLIATTIPLVAGIALLVFFWGMAKFILRAGDESGREEGKQIMMWGIVALFVMVSIWGIVTLLTNDFFGFSPVGLPQLPR